MVSNSFAHLLMVKLYLGLDARLILFYGHIFIVFNALMYLLSSSQVSLKRTSCLLNLASSRDPGRRGSSCLVDSGEDFYEKTSILFKTGAILSYLFLFSDCLGQPILEQLLGVLVLGRKYYLDSKHHQSSLYPLDGLDFGWNRTMLISFASLGKSG